MWLCIHVHRSLIDSLTRLHWDLHLAGSKRKRWRWRETERKRERELKKKRKEKSHRPGTEPPLAEQTLCLASYDPELSPRAGILSGNNSPTGLRDEARYIDVTNVIYRDSELLPCASPRHTLPSSASTILLFLFLFHPNYFQPLTLEVTPSNMMRRTSPRLNPLSWRIQMQVSSGSRSIFFFSIAISKVIVTSHEKFEWNNHEIWKAANL